MSKTNKRGRPIVEEEDKKKPNDKLDCKVCGGSYTRAHKSAHEKTKQHLIYAKLDDDIRKVVLNKPKQLGGTVTADEFNYHGASRRVRENFLPEQTKEKLSLKEMKRRLASNRINEPEIGADVNDYVTRLP